VLPHGSGSFGALVGRVVVEHDVGMVHRRDRVDVLRVPGVVVALDQVAGVQAAQCLTKPLEDSSLVSSRIMDGVRAPGLPRGSRSA